MKGRKKGSFHHSARPGVAEVAEGGGEGFASAEGEEDVTPFAEVIEMSDALHETVGRLERPMGRASWDMTGQKHLEEQFSATCIGRREVRETGIPRGVEAHIMRGDVADGAIEAVEAQLLERADEEHLLDG